MRRVALLSVGVAALVAGAGPSVAPARSLAGPEVMVVGRTAVLAGPSGVRAPATRVRVGGRRCRIAANTPVAFLAALRRSGGPSFRLRDYGSCSSRLRDAGGLYVSRIGREGARGRAGWVYKVGRRVSSLGAADPKVAVGRGKRVLWFWCRSASNCQRTLEVSAPARADPGQSVAVVVRGYDDSGRGVAVAGAEVALGDARATTDADGRATLTAPAQTGSHAITATRPGLVRSFPRWIAVG